jgi:hypothetical protein
MLKRRIPDWVDTTLNAYEIPSSANAEANVMDSAITQDDVIYFVVTDRFFGANKRSADPADKLIHAARVEAKTIDIFAAQGV